MVVLKAEPYGAMRSRAIWCRENTYENPYIAHRPGVPYETRWGTHTTPYGCLQAFCGPKIVGSPCQQVVQAQLSAMGSYGSENLVGSHCMS